MKDNRYFQMVYLLLEKGHMTAPELARTFEVSVRTIYRDIDILSSAGIPIYATQGKGGGIFLQEKYVLKKSLLSEQEQKQILMALQSMRFVDDEQADRLLKKLSGVFQKQNRNWIEIDFSSWTNTGVKKETFALLQSAIFKSRKVSFRYCNGKNEDRQRIVEPMKLVFKSSDWYLYAYSTLRQEYRFFKLTRIREVKMCVEEYHRVIPDEIFQRCENFAMDMIQVNLSFHKCMAVHVYERYDEEVKEAKDGRLFVETWLPDNELLYRYILSLQDKVEVLSPLRVRNEVQKRIKALYKIYET